MRKIIAALSLLILTSCSVNILTEFSDTTANDALFFDAKQMINAKNYTGAVAKFNAMSADYLAKRDVRSLRASAYLGLCSPIDFLDLVDAIGSIGGSRIMEWLMDTFQGGTPARQTSCVQAEAVMKSISALGVNRTADENLLMVFISFAKMGAIISRYGDSVIRDGAVDAGFNPCSAVAIPSADAKEIATGFNIAMDSLENVGSSTVGAGTLASVTTACAQLPAGMLPLCSDPPQVLTTDIDATEERGIRTLINESQDIGLGTCTGDAATCACP